MLQLIGGPATTALAAPLPDTVTLISLCTGAPAPDNGGQLLNAIADVAGVHHAYRQGEYRHDDDFAADRRRAAEILDSIAVSVLPPADPRLPSHTETVGAVIDRVAAWCALLRHPIPLTDAELVTAKARVEQLGRAYTTLARQLACGARRVPTRTDLTPLSLTGLRQIRRQP